LGGAAGARRGWSCALCLRPQRGSQRAEVEGGRRGGGRTRWGVRVERAFKGLQVAYALRSYSGWRASAVAPLGLGRTGCLLSHSRLRLGRGGEWAASCRYRNRGRRAWPEWVLPAARLMSIASLQGRLSALWTYRSFVLGMVARDFRGRYLGSALGGFWAVVN